MSFSRFALGKHSFGRLEKGQIHRGKVCCCCLLVIVVVHLLKPPTSMEFYIINIRSVLGLQEWSELSLALHLPGTTCARCWKQSRLMPPHVYLLFACSLIASATSHFCSSICIAASWNSIKRQWGDLLRTLRILFRYRIGSQVLASKGKGSWLSWPARVAPTPTGLLNQSLNFSALKTPK